MAAEKKGELRYSYISHDDWSHLPQAIEEFISLFDDSEATDSARTLPFCGTRKRRKTT